MYDDDKQTLDYGFNPRESKEIKSKCYDMQTRFFKALLFWLAKLLGLLTKVSVRVKAILCGSVKIPSRNVKRSCHLSAFPSQHTTASLCRDVEHTYANVPPFTDRAENRALPGAGKKNLRWSIRNIMISSFSQCRQSHDGEELLQRLPLASNLC